MDKMADQSLRSSLTQQVSSLRPDCLARLRGSQPVRTHLLGIMAQFMPQCQEEQILQVEELCCYDKMKKLMIGQSEQQSEKHEYQNNIMKAISIDNAINNMEKQYEKKTNIHEKNSKIAQLENKKQTKYKNIIKLSTINNLKQDSYNAYMCKERNKHDKNQNEIWQHIDKNIEIRISSLLEKNDVEKILLQKQNQKMQQQILENNIEMETIRLQNKQLKYKITQMKKEIEQKPIQIKQQQALRHLKQFEEIFNGMSIQQVQSKIQNLTKKCLKRFDEVWNKNKAEKIQENQIHYKQCKQLKETIIKFEKRQQSLLIEIRDIKSNPQISQIQNNQLVHCKQKLANLQNIIISLYKDWYAQRNQSEKKLMKNFNKLQENYGYQEMLYYVIDYDKKFSTNQKLNDYISKMLRGIQRIRRLLYPKHVNDKLDPFIMLQKIELWIKRRTLLEISKNNNEQSKMINRI